MWGQGYRLTAETRAVLRAALEGVDDTDEEPSQSAMQAAIDGLAAEHEALIAENQRLLALLADPPVGSKPSASDKGWRRFDKIRQSRRAPVLVIRGGRHAR